MVIFASTIQLYYFSWDSGHLERFSFVCAAIFAILALVFPAYLIYYVCKNHQQLSDGKKVYLEQVGGIIQEYNHKHLTQ